MNDLISRQAAIDALVNSVSEIGLHDNSEVARYGATFRQHEIIDIIEGLPSAQPERKKGKWQITDAYPHNVYCSECHKKFAQTHWAVWEDGSLPRNFCPNCGADMRGRDNERTD